MQQPRARKYNFWALVPSESDREVVHPIIYDKLVVATLNQNSKAEYTRIIDDLVEHGAEGISLDCTEIGLSVYKSDSTVPLFDTTRIHAVAAVDYALS